MRQPLTFVVTLLFDDHDTSDLRGRVRDVAGDCELPFRNADVLLAFMRREALQHVNRLSVPLSDVELEFLPAEHV